MQGTTLYGLARCSDKDIDRPGIKTAERSRIHVFLATSAIHREFKLKMTREQIIARAVEGVTRAHSYCDDIEFSPEDAARTEHDFLCEVVEAAIAAGASTINIPDTVGYATPQQMGETISMLFNRVPNIDQAVISTAQRSGISRCQCLALHKTEPDKLSVRSMVLVNELVRSLEEVVMALKTRQDFIICKPTNTHRLVPTNTTGRSRGWLCSVPAIVGQNAFAHEAGIHQDGMLKSATYNASGRWD